MSTPITRITGFGDERLWEINTFARHTPWLHTVMYDYATYGVVVFAALVAGWWIARRDSDPTRMGAAVWAGAATVLAVAINQPIVNAVHEPRPYTAIPGLLVLAHRSADYSFPSDHATMAGAAAAGLFLVAPRLGKIAAGAAVLLAFPRLHRRPLPPRRHRRPGPRHRPHRPRLGAAAPHTHHARAAAVRHSGTNPAHRTGTATTDFAAGTGARTSPPRRRTHRVADAMTGEVTMAVNVPAAGSRAARIVPRSCRLEPGVPQ
jgi:undecaprenyl-diphosphatase